jgi:hypothetical protein
MKKSWSSVPPASDIYVSEVSLKIQVSVWEPLPVTARKLHMSFGDPCKTLRAERSTNEESVGV